jgi:Tol biopolymer transport system component
VNWAHKLGIDGNSLDRRRCVVTGGMAVASLSASLWRVSTSNAAESGEVQGKLRRLTKPGGGDNRATFMPSGQTLLFASSRSGKSQIWRIDTDGGHAKCFYESAANDYGRVAPNSDGTRICFSSDRSGQNAVYVLDVASSRVTLVSDPDFWSFGPSWSSRDLLAFFSKKGGNMFNIWTVRPDGSRARHVTDKPGESRQPWWSPDGGTLAISADRGTGAFQIWLLAADGANARAITNQGSFGQPFWDPNGKKIAVSAKINEPHNRIYMMDADGSMLRPILQPEGDDNVHPAWSPDARSIVFTSGRDSKSALYVFEMA